MTKNVVTVASETRIGELVDLFRRRRITGAPVVDAAGRLVGLVSKDDVVFRGRGGHSEPPLTPDIRPLFSSRFVGFYPRHDGPKAVAAISTPHVIRAHDNDC